MSSIDLFRYEDYKSYVKDWVAQQPKRGYGQFRRMADCLRVSSVFVSQVFRGDRQLQPEQVAPLSQFMQHIEVEERYFLNLVYWARAGTSDLRALHARQIKEIRQQARSLKTTIRNDIELPVEVLAKFHASWAFSAIRLSTSIPGCQSIPAISERLGLEENVVHQALQFLVENGLCVKKGDEFHMGPRQTHLPAESPLIKNRQIAWRTKAFEKMDGKSDHQIFFTAPMALSREAKEHIHGVIRKTLAGLTKIAAESESETLVCLNLDWFEL